jgi:glycine hydroxymethyltransferase
VVSIVIIILTCHSHNNRRLHSLSHTHHQQVLEACAITTNKNSLPGDTSAVNPGGLRIGTPALTSRGMGIDEMKRVAKFLIRSAEVGVRIQEMMEEEGDGKVDGKGGSMKRFEDQLKDDLEIDTIRNEVIRFSQGYAVPGDEID